MHIPEQRNQQTFNGISKPGAARGLGKETPVCCVGITFQALQVFSVLGPDRSTVGITGAQNQRPERQGRWVGRARENNKGLTQESGDNVEKQQSLGAQRGEGSSQCTWCPPNSHF